VNDPHGSLVNGWDVEAWANVNQLGDTVAAHTHPGGVNMWAAIYYVDIGDSAGAPSSGFTRFMDMSGTPRPVRGGTPVSPPATGTRRTGAPSRNGTATTTSRCSPSRARWWSSRPPCRITSPRTRA
jgi:hypothetical protein